jgi:N-formylglutamate amidohydrolase
MGPKKYVPAFLGMCFPTLLADPFPPAARGGAPETSKLVFVRQGGLPIILSAPHGGASALPGVPVREGVGVAKFAKARDGNTAELTERLAAEIERALGGRPYVVLARFGRKFLDVNRPPSGAYESDKARPYYEAYHQALEGACREVQKEWGRGLLLDIHGQKGYPDALVRGTQNGKTVTLLRQRHGPAALSGPHSVLGHLEKAGYQILPRPGSRDEEPPRYRGGYIVQTYGSHQGHGIDAIQLEFGTRYREKGRLGRTAKDLAEAVRVFYRHYVQEAGQRKRA